MSRSDTPSKQKWLNWVGPAMLAAGLVGVGASAIAPEAALRTVSWTEEDAVEHQRASEELHRLSFTDSGDKEAQDALRAARVQFADLDGRLIEAADAPRRWRGVLRWGGVLLCVVGSVLTLGTRG